MRLEKKHRQELDRRKGSSVKTVIQTVWFLISLAVSYFIATYLINENVISYSSLYAQLRIPTSVPQWVVLGGVMLTFTFIAQFFLFIGFLVASPGGRRRTGKASLYSRVKDPFDNPYENY